jgi:ribosomal protein L29
MKNKINVQVLSEAEINTKLSEIRSSLTDERFTKGISENKDLSRFSKSKKDIARLLTELSRRRLS